MDRSRLAYVTAAAVGAGTAVFFIWWWWNRRQKDRPPSRWRKVGELSDLVCYPVKSLGPVRMNEMECTPLGLKSGWLRDRTLMVIDLNGQFITGRQLSKMVQVSPSISGSVLTLCAPGMLSVSIDLAKVRGKSFRAAVWGQAVPACDCGEEAARWLSRFLLQEDVGLRLVYYPLERPAREVRTKNKVFPLTDTIDTKTNLVLMPTMKKLGVMEQLAPPWRYLELISFGRKRFIIFVEVTQGAYPDVTSYTLLNEASIADLNNRLEEPVITQNFRMNFVVKGAEVLEEDYWEWIKIGKTVFRNVKPCTRCIFTTINPETGLKNPKVEPLKTLKKYRQMKDPELRAYTGDSPVMGIHLGLRSKNGIVKLGDPVYVGIMKKEEEILNTPP